MAVSTTNVSSGPFTGNGVTTVFPFTFRALSAGEVRVEIDGVGVGESAYDVAIVGTGGTVTFTAPPTGQVLILSDPDFTQSINFEDEGRYAAGNLNEGNDRAAVRDLWLRDRLQTALDLVGIALDRSVPGVAIPVVSSLYSLAHITAPVAGQQVWLSADGRTGLFEWHAGDYAARVAGDTLQGLYVASAAVSASVGCWVRYWDGTHGRPEWFGAKANDQAADCLAALNACHALCPTMLLGDGTYYVSATFKANLSDRTIIGVGGGYGGGPASTIAILSTTATALQVGADSYGAIVRGQRVSGICATRVGVAPAAATAVTAAASVLVQWTTNTIIEDVRAKGSPVGFRVTNTSNVTMTDANYQPATSAGADWSVGYLLGGYAVFPGFVGNNGSLRLCRCTAYEFPVATFTAHTRLFGYTADTWFYDCEGSLGKCGIEIDGRDAGGSGITTAGAHQDIRVRDISLDGFSTTAVYAHHLNSSASVEIEGHYLASSGTCIALNQIGGGCVTIGKGKAFASGPGQIGLTADTVGFLTIDDTFLRDFSQPMILANCNGHRITATISNQVQTTASAAVRIENCDRGFVRPSIKGAAAAFPAAVTLDSACGYSEVNGSGIDPGCLVGADLAAQQANKVRYDGGDARTAFGTNVLSGVTG